jgi:hypothetical protein
MRLFTISLSAYLALTGCSYLSSDLESSDGIAILVDMQGEQPHSSENGVLVRISSRGGMTLGLTIEHGTLVTGARCADTNYSGSEPCLCFSAAGQLAASIRPQDTEALLTIVLYDDAKCAETALASKQVAISAVPTNESVDAGVDAPVAGDGSIGDGGIDAM